MKYPDLRRRKMPFQIRVKKTGEVFTVVKYEDAKANYHLKVFLSDGTYKSLRFVLQRCELVGSY